LERHHPLLERWIGSGQDSYGEQAGAAGAADGHSSNRHAGGHLDDHSNESMPSR
jgi:hypothetical protein